MDEAGGRGGGELAASPHATLLVRARRETIEPAAEPGTQPIPLRAAAEGIEPETPVIFEAEPTVVVASEPTVAFEAEPEPHGGIEVDASQGETVALAGSRRSRFRRRRHRPGSARPRRRPPRCGRAAAPGHPRPEPPRRRRRRGVAADAGAPPRRPPPPRRA